jgi:hypothetical protein
MENPIVSLFIFVVVVLLYLHIIAQWKRSEDLEIYETDFQTHSQLQEVCSVRQPVIFVFNHTHPIYSVFKSANLAKYSATNVYVKDGQDFWNIPVSPDTPSTVDPISLSYDSARRLCSSDPHSRYFSENNTEFLEESGLERTLSGLDAYLKPGFCLYSKQDLLFGAKHASTPLRYHTNTMLFVIPIAGKIAVKMTPWKSGRYLYPMKDYEYYDFRSSVNVWNTQEVYRDDVQHVQFLEFDVHPGYMLFIPPYWWYSIRFSTDTENSVCTMTYDTIMSSIANGMDWVKYYLQQTNIHTRISNAPTPETTNELPPMEIGNEPVKSNSTVSLPESDGTATVKLNAPHTDPALPPTHTTTNEPKSIITNAGVYHV